MVHGQEALHAELVSGVGEGLAHGELVHLILLVEAESKTEWKYEGGGLGHLRTYELLWAGDRW